MIRPQDTDARVIAAIDRLAGDEFCADLEFRLAFHPEKLTSTEKEAAEKLGRIYILAHAFNRSNSCYSVHESWRKELEQYTE